MLKLCPQRKRAIGSGSAWYRRDSNGLTILLLLAIKLALIQNAQKISAADASRYIPNSPGKTVVTRPAMRLSRVRLPTGSRRVYLRTRRPIITNNRGIITGGPPKPILRRIQPIFEQDSEDKTRSRVFSIATTDAVDKTTEISYSSATTTTSTVSSTSSTPILTTDEEILTTVSTTPSETHMHYQTQVIGKAGSSASSTFSRKSSRLRNMSILHALRRMNKDVDYSGLIKKLDYFMAYYPTVREAASRLSSSLTKHEHASREERRRIWKGFFRVKSEVRSVGARCDGMHRNITDVVSKIGRHVTDFASYQRTAKKKIDQIEIHQGSQDIQYFETYERSANNSKELKRLQLDMAILLPLVSEIVRNQEQDTLFEKRALEQLDSHARGNIAEMANQILIQQNTLVNLGNKVRSEIEQLYQQKQSMSRSMEQHQKRITDSVNAHVSVHVRKLNGVESNLNRHAENIKYILSVIGNHGELLDDGHEVEQIFVQKVNNITDDVTDLKRNLIRINYQCKRNEVRLNKTEAAVENLRLGSNHMRLLLSDQHATLEDVLTRINITEKTMSMIAEDFNTYQDEQDQDTENVRQGLDKLLQKHGRLQQNVSRLLKMANSKENRYVALSQYPSDEPAPESTSVTPQELMTLLTEIGVEDRMTRLTRVLRHQQQRMSNVTRAVLRIAEDNEAIASTTSHYYNLISAQAKIIREQNNTIGKLASIASNQGQTIKSLSIELGGAQETVMKLTNIIASIASQMKSPMGSQRDCHDVWLNGNRKSGVYNVIEDMSVRPIHCNLTDYGGWTVIQRRKDGSQDFDKNMNYYQRGFGDVYGEYWLGLETIKTLTQKVRSSVGLQIILEDWDGKFRHATYSQFYLYGSTYNIQVSGFRGDVGDSLSPANGSPFSANPENGEYAQNNPCPKKWRGGWWFPSLRNCGEINLNGVFRKISKPDPLSPTSIHWKRWHGIGYPLKSVTMQIIPTDVLNSRFRGQVLDQYATEDDVIDDSKLANAELIAQQMPSFMFNAVGTQTRSEDDYDSELKDPEMLIRDESREYDNLDYNLLLGDG